jgi:predicted ABC-type transport system involved in lysophospholipase L1 biosynthesis ATPase subunit
MRLAEEVPLLRLERIAKTFPSELVALRGVDLEIARADIYGLLEANGAEKSTLIKILYGVSLTTSGQIIWRGSRVQRASPRDANEMGVATVHQYIRLDPTLMVIENVFLADGGRQQSDLSLQIRYREICAHTGYWLDPERVISDLSVGQRQSSVAGSRASAGSCSAADSARSTRQRCGGGNWPSMHRRSSGARRSMTAREAPSRRLLGRCCSLRWRTDSIFWTAARTIRV